MRNLILFGFLSLILFKSLGQDSSDYIRTYKFGNYTIKTAYCKENPSIEIIQNGNTIYYDCSGEGYGYTDIDTLTINSDKLQDFIFCYKMEDYTIVGIFVSTDKSPFYRDVDIVYVFAPDIYGYYEYKKGEILKIYILKDINKDGKRELITNVIERKGHTYPIKNFTDTISNKEIMERIEGKIKEPFSRAIFLDIPDSN
ncbi:MAG: hypothetical protein NTZ33_11200 [Bacteroidetes bacterium]|nr:hypothetical protein [Bacteroidota bacterium]